MALPGEGRRRRSVLIIVENLPVPFDRRVWNEAVTLVGDARSALGVRIVGVLDGRGLAGDECVLAVVNGMGKGIGKTEISSVGNAAIDGERASVIEA